jgi:poly(A) polymerase
MLLINKLFSRFTKKKQQPLTSAEPVIIPRSEHSISRKQISKNALRVLYELKDAGFEAYLVGGCVRDLLLGHTPKDFDVATNALPEQVHDLFKRSRLIGRRFKLVHVRFGREVIEVATFRAPPEAEQHVDDEGKIVADNVYGTLEQDAWRRDFTINALYYNIRDFSIVDYTGGLADLEQRKIRLIGDVETRYREDPVRILRALRFVAKLDLNLDGETERYIDQLAHRLTDIAPARLFDESLKLYLSGNAVVIQQLLEQYDVFKFLFPQTAELLVSSEQEIPKTLLIKALENTDVRIKQNKPVTPAFLFAALLWAPLCHRWQQIQASNVPAIPALQRAAAAVLSEQVSRVAIPKRYSLVTKDIWSLQPRFELRQGKRAFRTLAYTKFRAGYDFLALRAEAGEELTELVAWWTTFQEVDDEQQSQMIKALPRTGQAKRRRPRRRRRKPAVTKVD